MVFELSQLATGFEGCEKKLQIRFVGADLRRIPLDSIVEILTAAKCTILQSKHNEFFDAYVLSESSLFVYPDQIILKTCGTTALLHCMPVLLAAAAEIGAKPHLVQFSRSNFMFPHLQPFPHRNFSTEVHYLNTMFDGSAYILGAINGPRWHVYFSDVIPREQLPDSAFQKLPLAITAVPEKSSDEEKEPEHQEKEKERALINPTLEIVMFDLCPEAMSIYYKSEEIQTGEQCTLLAGIDQLIPGSDIDAFLFEPCGYSCNGLREDVYFTIHITPEPECSFVSFETNLGVEDYTELVGKVLRCFRPGSFSVSLMVDDHSPVLPHSREGMQWRVPGFRMHQLTSHSFAGGYNITAGQYVSDRHHQLQQEQRLAFVQQQQLSPEGPVQTTQVVMTTPGSGNEPESVLVEASVSPVAATAAVEQKKHALVMDVANFGADSAVGEMLLGSTGLIASAAAAEDGVEVDGQQQPVFGIEATAEFLKRMQEAIPTVAEALTPLASPTTAAVLQQLHRNGVVQQQQQGGGGDDDNNTEDLAESVAALVGDDNIAVNDGKEVFAVVELEDDSEIHSHNSHSVVTFSTTVEDEEEVYCEDSPIHSNSDGTECARMRVSSPSSGSSTGGGKSPRNLEEEFSYHTMMSGSGSSGMSQSDEDYFSATDSNERMHHHHHHHHLHLLKKRGTSFLPALTLKQARELEPAQLEELACQVIRSSHYDACVLGETAQEDDSDAPTEENPCASELRRELLSRIIQDDDTSDGEAFFLVDIPELAQRYGQFLKALPRVEPFYNVRCNNDPGVIRVLNQLGCGFQCNSGTSLRMLGEEFGVDTTERIAFVNPWKPAKQISTARDLGVPLLAFDHESELHKIKRHYPDAQLLLQIDPFSGDLPALISAAKRAVAGNQQLPPFAPTVAAAVKQQQNIQSDGSVSDASSHSDSVAEKTGAVAARRKKERHSAAALKKRAARLQSNNLRAARQQQRGPSATHGASIDSVESLLQTVWDLGLNLAGVSVKLSTKKRCCEARHMCRGIRAAKAVFDLAKARFGLDLRVLDIGDTFPNPSAWCSRHRRSAKLNSSATAAAAASFPEMARQVNQTLEQLFPSRQHPGLRILADPARYIVTTTHTLAVSVIGKREVSLLEPASSGGVGGSEDALLSGGYLSSGDESAASSAYDSGDDSMCSIHTIHSPLHQPNSSSKVLGCQYYINDGLYGSFNCLLYDSNHARVAPKSVRPLPAETPLLRSTLFGPTCDGLDCVMEECELPELQVGDWLYFEDMGAHTLASGTNFNGFVMPQSRYLVALPLQQD